MAAGRSTLLRRAGSFLALLAFEVGAVVLLTQLGHVPALRIPWHSLTPWLLNSPVEDVLAAILRMIALLIAWWLLATNLLYLLASLIRVPGAIRAVRWCTLPVVRTVTDHAVAFALATSLMGGGAGATIAAATPAVAAAPQRSGPVATGQAGPHDEAVRAGMAGPAGYLPSPAGTTLPAETPAGTPRPAGYVPQAAGLGSPRAQQPGPREPGYDPQPAGPPPAAQTDNTSTSSSSSTTTSSTTPPSTSKRGYVPRAAGPPSDSSTTSSSSTTSTTATTSTTSTTSPTATTSTSSTTSPTATTRPPGTTAPGPVHTPTPRQQQRPQANSHQVLPGDNLWTISRDHLAQVTERPASELSDHAIAAYWLRVIAANRDSLRSGDPDLIFPGESVRLPPVRG